MYACSSSFGTTGGYLSTSSLANAMQGWFCILVITIISLSMFDISSMGYNGIGSFANMCSSSFVWGDFAISISSTSGGDSTVSVVRDSFEIRSSSCMSFFELSMLPFQFCDFVLRGFKRPPEQVLVHRPDLRWYANPLAHCGC